MGKVRIHLLAKELGVGSSELIDMLKADGFDPASASSSIDEDVAQRFRTRLAGTTPASAAKAPAVPSRDAAQGAKPAAAKPGAAGKKASPPPPPPGKRGIKPATPPLVLPPPAPIQKRPKAVKPGRPAVMSPEILAAIEGRRYMRGARMRGELASEVVAAPAGVEPSLESPDVSAVEPPVPTMSHDEAPALAAGADMESAAGADDALVAGSGIAEPTESALRSAAMPTADSGIGTGAIQLPHVVRLPHVVQPPPPPPPVQLPHVVQAAPPPQLPHVVEPAPTELAPSATQLPHVVQPPPALSLPHVVSPPRAPGAPGIPQPPRAPLSAAQQQPPGLPMRGVREFRGPLRKIELPPQPQRPGYGGRPSGPPMSSQRPGGQGQGQGQGQFQGQGQGLGQGQGQAQFRPGQAPSGMIGPGQGLTRTFTQKPGTGLGKSKAKRKGRDAAPPPIAPVAPIKKGDGALLRLTEGVTVKELADKMEVKAKDIIRILMMRGVMVTVNMALDPELAKTIAGEFGYNPEVVSFEDDLQAQEEEAIIEAEKFEGEEEPRPPVVTVMGHVDHGKTSLLDAIRKTKVAAGEAGGITQSIGAYQVDVNGRKVTFIDTPGHAAFTSMRSRGAQVTDIVILVVAATDSVMPQTIEAVNHAKAAGVPIIVAVNKMDLPGAKADRVKTDLMAHGLVAEEFGGDVVFVPVSARMGTGVEQLLEMVNLTADMRGLKASINRRATGTVLEAGIDRGMGPFANVIVQDGTLRPGDSVIVGAEFGRIRALFDATGKRVSEAGPSTPVQMTGLVGVPKAGDRFQVLENESRAREISDFRQHKRRDAELAKSGARGTLQDISKAIAEGETKELAIVVKADVHGVVEVLTKTLTELSTSKVRAKIIHSGTGAITDSDVLLASASKAIIVGFNIRPERSAAELAEREKVVIRQHEIIYELVDELKKLMAGLLDAVREEEFLGRAEVRQTFKVSRVGTIAGCYVQDGKIARSAEVRLVRDGAIVWTGRLATLKRFKDDAREVQSGFECGIGLEGFNDVKVGDTIEAFTIRETRPESI